MMSSKTGRKIDLAEHLKQSLGDLFTTTYGERVQREGYASILPELIDMPQTEALRLQAMAGVIMSIAQWEPRLIVRKVDFTYTAAGRGVVSIYGEHNGQKVAIEDIVL